MESIADFTGQRVYLDANILIYAIEDVAEFSAPVRLVFAGIDRGDFSAVTSELSLAECLTKPLLDNRRDIVQTYLAAFETRRWFSAIPVDRATLIEAAEIRTGKPLKLPDAIHVATARRAACNAILTNDQRLRSAGIPIRLLAEIGT